MNFKIYNRGDYSSQLVEKLMVTIVSGEKVLANICKNNIPSIKFHKNFGFKLNNEQPIDSYGEFSNNDEQYELLIK